MNITQESVTDFAVGHGGADAVARPIVDAGYARKAYKGVRVRAATANTITIYVGTRSVKKETGYPLPAGEEVSIPIENPSRVYVIATLAANSQQTVTLSGEIAGDTFTLTLDGETTDPISVTAEAAAVQAALEALSTIGEGNCTVTGDAGGPYTVEFTGDLANVNVSLMVGMGLGVNETQNVTVTDALADDMLVLTLGAESTSELAYDSTSAQIQTALEGLTGIGAGNVSVSDGTTGWDIEFIGDLAEQDVDPITGVCGKNEVQNIEIIGGAAGDMLTLTYDGTAATPVAYDASAIALQGALDSIPALTGRTQAVGGGGTPWNVEFIDTLAKTDVVMISGVCGRNEQQTVAIDDASNGGTFTLTFDAQTTAPINHNAAAGDVEDALELLSNVGAGQVAATGGPGPGTDWVVEFKGTLARTDVPAMTGDGSLLTGGSTDVTITETVAGHGAAVAVAEFAKGNEATVTVTESQPGDATCTVTVAKVADITSDSQYSWLAV